MGLSALRRIRILVVDDQADMRTLARAMLIDLGFTNVDLAGDGFEAYRKFVLKPAALVITDLEMAPVHGLELARMIRFAADSPNRYVPVMVMSDDTDPNTVRRARDAGVNDFMVKPLTMNALSTRIESLMTRRQNFVRAAAYAGPDRRRRQVPPPHGIDRRADPRDVTAMRLQEVVRPDHRPPHMGGG